MKTHDTILSVLSGTTSLVALSIVMGMAPVSAYAAGDGCEDSDREDTPVTCVVDNPDTDHVKIILDSSQDGKRDDPTKGNTGPYTLIINTPLNNDEENRTVVISQEGGSGDNAGDSGGFGDTVTVNLNATVVHGSSNDQDDDKEHYGVIAFSTGGEAEDGEGDNDSPETQGGDGGDGGPVTITGANGATVTVFSDSEDGVAGVAGVSQGGDAGDQADNGDLFVDEKGGDGGEGGDVAISMASTVTVNTTGEGFAIGIAGLSRGTDGGGDSGPGGGADTVTISANAVAVNADLDDDADMRDAGDIADGSFGGVTGVFAYSSGNDGHQSGDANAGGAGSRSGDVTVTANGPISVMLDVDEPLEDLAPSAGIYALSKAGDGGNSSDNALNQISEGGDGKDAGNVAVTAHGTITTGAANQSLARNAQVMGVLAQSRAGNGGKGNDKGRGGDGGDAQSVSVTTFDGSDISTAGDRSNGVFAESRGGDGGEQDPDFQLIGTGQTAGFGGDGSTVTVSLGAPESPGGSITGASVTTLGTAAHAVQAQSIGGRAGDADGGVSLFGPGSGDGGDGGKGGTVTVTSNASIATSGARAVGILAQSLGAGGGGVAGGASGKIAVSGEGGAASTGGTVSVTQSSNLSTQGNAAPGILAMSVGGGGGDTAKSSGGIVAVGGQGGAGADAGQVSVAFGSRSAVDVNGAAGRTVAGAPQLTTQGDYSYGLIGQSIGGGGGDGGDIFSYSSIIPAVGVGGDGGGAGNGDTVTLRVGDDAGNARIRTSGDNAHAVVGHSIGGGGGTGGDANAVGFSITGFAIAGGGSAGGDGGAVTFEAEDADISTTGGHATGIALRSIGGGGGSGGNASSTSGFIFFSTALAVAGQGSGGGNGGSVDATLSGSRVTTGDVTYADVTDGHGVLAQSIGGGGGAGGSALSRTLVLHIPFDPPLPAASLSFALGADGGDGGDGGTASVEVDGSSSVLTQSDTSHGVFAQSVGGGGGLAGTGTAAGTIVQIPGAVGEVQVKIAIGGSGGNGGDGSDASASVAGDITTQGHFSNAVYLQSIGGGGGDAGTGSADSLKFKTRKYQYFEDKNTLAEIAEEAAEAVEEGLETAGEVKEVTSIVRFPLKLTFETAIGGTGGDGGNGGDLEVSMTPTGRIATSGEGSRGVLGQTIGGGGGASQGANVVLGIGDVSDDGFVNNLLSQSLFLEIGRTGGGASDGGDVAADLSSTIATTGADADGVLIQSIGGGGGVGGSTAGRSGTESGLFNPLAEGIKSIDKRIDTNLSLGGRGGAAGNGGTLTGTDGGGVRLAGTVTTAGDHAEGIVLQTIGGGGGTGGAGAAEDSNRVLRAVMVLGGTGGAGGNGGDILANLASGQVATQGFASHGVVLQTIGGGGGLGGSGSRQSCEDVAVGGGRRSALGASIAAAASAPLGSDTASDAADQDAACLELSEQAVLDDPETGNQGTSGDGGDIALSGGQQIITANTSGDHAHGIITQSIGGGGGIGASGATNLSTDGAGNATTRSSFVHVGGNAANGADTVTGEGGDITLSARFNNTTTGDGAAAVVVQSIGGGGGIYDVDGISSLDLGGKGASGTGGTLSVVTEGSTGITTTGEGASGLVVQSIGGGGGLVTGTLATDALNGSDPIALRVGGTVDAASGGGTVNVIHGVGSGALTGISTHGDGARGIIAQSIGGGGGTFTSLYAGMANPTVATPLHIGGHSSGPGSTVHVGIEGNITTDGAAGDAVVAQSIGGGGGIGDLAETTLNTRETDITVGGDGGANGNGSVVSVLLDNGVGGASILTTGRLSNGVLAQSIGGGGGLASDLSFPSSEGQLEVGATGGDGGNGAAVSITGTATRIETQDAESHGLVAQSIGGGGGVGRVTASSSGTGTDVTLGGRAGANASAGSVTVDVGAVNSLVTAGDRAIGILAQSIGGGGGIAATGASDQALRITTGGATAANAGGAVSVALRDVSGATGITTRGVGAHGIVAQSIGGGGGIAGAPSLSVANLESTAVLSGITALGTQGDGGSVSVQTERNITTQGSDTYAIIGQSIGGGGGIIGINGGIAGRNPNGSGRSGPVNVAVATNSIISANGFGSGGILAQSLADSVSRQGAVTVTIDGQLTTNEYGVVVTGGNSANKLTVNAGATINSLTGKAVAVFDTGGGTLTVDNAGQVFGSIVTNSPPLTGSAPAARVQTSAAPTARVATTTQFSVAAVSPAQGVTILNRAGGVLSGATRYDADVTNEGRIEVGSAAPLVIAGNFTQGATGHTAIGRLGTGTAAPRLQIGGAAQLAGTLGIEDAAPVKGRALRALRIDGATTGQFDTVRFGPVDYSQKVENGVLTLTAERTRFGTPDVALSKQQAAIGRHLDAAFAAGEGTSDFVAQAAFASAANPARTGAVLAGILDQLAPGAILAPAASAIARMPDRFDTLIGCDNAAGITSNGTACMKFDARAGTLEQDADDDAAGYDEDFHGVTVGAEFPVAQGLSAGFTVGYENSDIQGTKRQSAVDGTALALGLSLTKRIGDLDLSLAGVGSIGDYSSTRSVTVGTTSNEATADYTAWSLAARARAAYQIEWGTLRLRPSLDLDVIQSAHDGFTETTDGLAGLTVDSGSEVVFQVTPSLTVSGGVDLGGGRSLTARAGLGVTVSSGDDYTVDAALSAANPAAGTFDSAIALPGITARAQAGLTLALSEDAALELDYRGLFSDETEGHAISGRLAWNF